MVKNQFYFIFSHIKKSTQIQFDRLFFLGKLNKSPNFQKEWLLLSKGIALRSRLGYRIVSAEFVFYCGADITSHLYSESTKL